MAKPSAHGSEIYRCFSTQKRGLVSVRSDLTALIRRPGGGWKLLYKARPGVKERAVAHYVAGRL